MTKEQLKEKAREVFKQLQDRKISDYDLIKTQKSIIEELTK